MIVKDAIELLYFKWRLIMIWSIFLMALTADSVPNFEIDKKIMIQSDFEGNGQSDIVDTIAFRGGANAGDLSMFATEKTNQTRSEQNGTDDYGGNEIVRAQVFNTVIYLPLIMRAPLPSIWISSDELASLPTSGPAWDNLFEAAQQNTNAPNIRDKDDNTDVYMVAKALVYARTGETRYRDEVVAGIKALIETQINQSNPVLPIARNVQGYVIAADLVNLAANNAEDLNFRNWLVNIRSIIFTDGPNLSIITCHEIRPNNWGNHCGASRIAIALYLNDTVDLDRAATVFRGYLGDRQAYVGFVYGSDLSWQCDPKNPIGVNPKGCSKEGHAIDGALPDDMRRGGSFEWPPRQTGYPWEALQGALVQAEMLHRAGYPAWEWEDQALLRAVQFLYSIGWEATGDDEWQIWLINDTYGTTFPTNTPTQPGKNIGWTDWTHAN